MGYYKGVRRVSRTKMQQLITNGQTDPDVTYITPDNTQYDTMPAASADLNGVIAQYTGTTDSTYTQGYFYKCNGTTWEQIDVDPYKDYVDNAISTAIGNVSQLLGNTEDL